MSDGENHSQASGPPLMEVVSDSSAFGDTTAAGPAGKERLHEPVDDPCPLPPMPGSNAEQPSDSARVTGVQPNQDNDVLGPALPKSGEEQIGLRQYLPTNHPHHPDTIALVKNLRFLGDQVNHAYHTVARPAGDDLADGRASLPPMPGSGDATQSSDSALASGGLRQYLLTNHPHHPDTVSFVKNMRFLGDQVHHARRFDFDDIVKDARPPVLDSSRSQSAPFSFQFAQPRVRPAWRPASESAQKAVVETKTTPPALAASAD